MPTAFADDDERGNQDDPAEQGKYGERDQPAYSPAYEDGHPPDDPDDPNPPAARQSER